MGSIQDRLVELVEKIDRLDAERAELATSRDAALVLLARKHSVAALAEMTGMSRQMVHRIVGRGAASAAGSGHVE